MPRLLALTLLATLALAPAADAAAKPPKRLIRWTYSVKVEGTLTFHHAVERPAIGGIYSTVDDLTMRWTSKMPRLQLLDGRVLNMAAAKVKVRSAETKRSVSMPDPQGGVATGDCAGTTATAGTAQISDGRLAPLVPKQARDVNVDLTPFSGVNAPFECTGKLHGPGVLSLLDATSKGDTFGLNFDLPDEAVGKGKVIQLFDKPANGCPAPEDPHTTACTARIEGTVTLRRTGRKVLGPRRR